MIAVEGHTDSDPLPKNLREKYASNWELSGARAAVGVIDRLKVDPVRLQSVGYGEFVPRDKNTAEIITADLIQKYNSTPQQSQGTGE